MGFNKFEWIEAVAADGRIPDGERFVLIATAVRYVTYGEDVFHVRQVTIAERFAVSDRTVQRAQARARDLGYLVLVRPRQRGRTHRGADHHQLVIPDNLSPITGEIPDTDDGNTRHRWPKYPTEMTEIPDRADPSTSGNNHPKGSLTGSLKGSLRGSDAALTPTPIDAELINDDPEPREFCPTHMPYGTSNSCGGCLTARKNHERWTHRRIRTGQPIPAALSTADLRVAQTQALKAKFRTNPPELLP
jgi:hypothetical protein